MTGLDEPTRAHIKRGICRLIATGVFLANEICLLSFIEAAILIAGLLESGLAWARAHTCSNPATPVKIEQLETDRTNVFDVLDVIWRLWGGQSTAVIVSVGG